jgi:hypothetical protein
VACVLLEVPLSSAQPRAASATASCPDHCCFSAAVHCVWACRGQASSINEHRHPLGWLSSKDVGCKSVDRDGRDPSQYGCCLAHPNSGLKNKSYGRLASADKIGLFHYVTRSKEDYLIKIGKSVIGIGGSPKKLEYFSLVERCAEAGLCVASRFVPFQERTRIFCSQLRTPVQACLLASVHASCS